MSHCSERSLSAPGQVIRSCELTRFGVSRRCFFVFRSYLQQALLRFEGLADGGYTKSQF